MKTTESSKPTARTSRTRTATGSITNPQSQRFERLFMYDKSNYKTSNLFNKYFLKEFSVNKKYRLESQL